MAVTLTSHTSLKAMYNSCVRDNWIHSVPPGQEEADPEGGEGGQSIQVTQATLWQPQHSELGKGGP